MKTERLVGEVKETFFNEFNSECVVAFAPGRINIIGEHTDYNEGFVLPASIHLGTAVAIQFNDSNTCNIIAKDMNESVELSVDENLKSSSTNWHNYIIGILTELMNKKIPLKGFNLVFAGSIPIGSGLSSSAAFENAVLLAINKIHEFGLKKLEIAHISQSAEHNAVGVKCGLMDQYASMFGKKDHAIFLDCKNETSKLIPLCLTEYELLLINTHVSHSLADSAYNERRESCERVSAHFQVPSLRHISQAQLKGAAVQIEKDDFEKAQFVLAENKRVEDAVNALSTQDIITLGKLLFQSHEGLRNKYKVSCAELDFLVDEAQKSKAVIGSRMMGGGFGGFTVNLVKKGMSDHYFNTVSHRFFEKFGTHCSSLNVSIEDGAKLIP